jgi:hypothetical protein
VGDAAEGVGLLVNAAGGVVEIAGGVTGAVDGGVDEGGVMAMIVRIGVRFFADGVILWRVGVKVPRPT